MIAYKVVNGPSKVTKRTAFRPATSLALQRVKYHIGRTTEPDDSGPLACFQRLRDAANWLRKTNGTHVLLVEIEESSSTSLWKNLPPIFVKNRWGRGYHAESAGITERPLDDCPAGTILADSVHVLADITAMINGEAEIVSVTAQPVQQLVAA